MLLFFVLVILSTQANAQLLYTDCIYANDFGESNDAYVLLRPVGKICYDRCEIECQAFSRFADNTTVELNYDIIQSCMTACMSGSTFSSTVREYSAVTTGFPFTVSSTTYTTGSACSATDTAIDSAANNEYDTELLVAPGDKVQIKVAGIAGLSNEIYMCGYEIKLVYPSYEAMKMSDWDSNVPSWNPAGNSIWNARNPYYVDMGLYVKDGDLLSIGYGGQYVTCNSAPCDFHQSDANLMLKKPTDAINKSYTVVDSGNIIPGSQLQIMLTDSTGMPTGSQTAYDIATFNSTVEIFGLKGAVPQQVNTRFAAASDINTSEGYYYNGEVKISGQDIYRTFSGTLTGYSTNFARLALGHSMSTFASGASWINNVSPPDAPKNLGGYMLEITRKGCPFYNGALVQYGIKETISTAETESTVSGSNDEYNTSVTAWYDVDSDVIMNFDYINIPEGGKLFLRIKSIDYDTSLAPQCNLSESYCGGAASTTANLYKSYNRGGQYAILVSKQKEDGQLISIIRDVVGIVKGYLFGTGADTTGATGQFFSGGSGTGSNVSAFAQANSQGIVQHLFNRYVSNSMLVNAIRATLVLYIAWVGLSFMIGISPMTQKEALVIIGKITIVVALISPNSWEFFNTTFFNLFVDGTSEIIANIATPADAAPATLAEYRADPSLAFNIFDVPFRIMTSKQTWIKLTALIFSGLIGFVGMLLMVISIVVYLIVIMKAVLIYLMSLIGIAVLLLMAPIFITFMLFKFTKQMFDAWVKQLFSFAFQPIFVFSFLIVINYILILMLKTSLGFTACSTCLLTLDYIADTLCIFPGYTAIFYQHVPDDSLIPFPAGLMSAMLGFMIAVQASYVFVSFGAQIAMTILTGSQQGVALNQAAGDAVSSVGSFVQHALGVDQGVMRGGQAYRGMLDKRAAKKELSTAEKGAKDRLKALQAKGLAPAGSQYTGPNAKPLPPIPGAQGGVGVGPMAGGIAGLDNPPPNKPLPPIPDPHHGPGAKPLPEPPGQPVGVNRQGVAENPVDADPAPRRPGGNEG